MATVAVALVSSCTFVRFDGSSVGKRIVGNGNVGTRSFEVSDFSKIELSVPFDVRYETVSGEPYAYATGYENILDVLSFEVKGNTLKMKFKEDYSVIQNGDLDIRIGSKSLNSLIVAGSADFEAENLHSENFAIALKGSGDIDINGLDANVLDVAIAGSGDVKVSGLSGQSANLVIAGSGDIKLSGKADEVSAAILGSGDIDIKGLKCKNVSSEVKGSGKVLKR